MDDHVEESPQTSWTFEAQDQRNEPSPGVQSLPSTTGSEDPQGAEVDEPYFPTFQEATDLNKQAIGDYHRIFGDSPEWGGVLKPNELGSALASAQQHYHYGPEKDDAERYVQGLGKMAWRIAGNQVFSNGNKRSAYHLTQYALDQSGLGHLSPIEQGDPEFVDHLIDQDREEWHDMAQDPRDWAQDRENRFLNMWQQRYRQGGITPGYQQRYPEGTYITDPEEAQTQNLQGLARRSNILDSIHNELSSLVFDNPASEKPILKPAHAHWIKKEIYATLDKAGYTDVADWLSLILTGSICTYQYSNDSDIDVSLFVDSRIFPEWSRAEMIALMVDKMDGRMLPGTQFPMQDFVVGEGIKPSDLYKPGLRSGYNLDNNKWIVPPERDRAHDVQKEEGGFYAWGLQMADKMERLLKYEPEQAIAFWHSIHKKRQRDMMKGKGDFSESNIVYKFLANRGLFPQLSEASGEYIAKTAANDWFAPSYMIPDDAKQQIHQWAQTLPWPEGSKFAPPERYHVTGIYSPSGFSDPSHHEWIQSHGGLTYPVQSTGVDNFTPSKVGEGAPVVLRVHHPQLEEDTERLIDEAQRRGLPVSRFPGGYKPHITVGHSPTPIQADHPGLSFPVGPLRDLHSYYDELKRTAGAPIKPPNLRQGAPSKNCLSCKMYHKSKGGRGKCWGYGEYDVRGDQLCDSYEKETRNLLNKFTKMAAPYDRQVAKYIYDPQANHLLLGEMGREEGEKATHNQLRSHPVWGEGLPPYTTWGTIGLNGYAEANGGMNYHDRYKTEEALRRAVPGAKFTNPAEMLIPEWAIEDPKVTYVGEPPAIQPAEEEDKRWDFQAKVDLNQVAQRIYEGVKNGSGGTFNLHGESPHTRYGFAPDLATQTPISLETFSPQDVLDFIERFSDRLADPEKFVGSWVQGDQVILDVSEGHDSYDVAHQRAWDGHQLAMWDSQSNEEVPVRGLDYQQPATET
jgi:hypothetical protein